MKMLIKEFAEFTGVSVRTLHYYNEIGLLIPALVDKHSGYRFYDENSLMRMQEILFYRELDFSLKSISDILSSPDYDKEMALAQQKKLLIKGRFIPCGSYWLNSAFIKQPSSRLVCIRALGNLPRIYGEQPPRGQKERINRKIRFV